MFPVIPSLLTSTIWNSFITKSVESIDEGDQFIFGDGIKYYDFSSDGKKINIDEHKIAIFIESISKQKAYIKVKLMVSIIF
ncbi:MAG: hypothetical protein KFW21_04685 [Spirochaetota bacterium]|nr:hypothetical protein [Spirochaetota bacterium]